MFRQALVIIRSRCMIVYTVGEHGTAFFYAVCELPERIVHVMLGDWMLYAFSIVLLVGVAAIGIDKLLAYFGL